MNRPAVHGGGHHAGGPLGWPASAALYGGAALYLAGRLLFLWLSEQAVRPAQAAVAVVALLLLPVGRVLPPAAALGVLAALLVTAAVGERLTRVD